MSSLDGTSQLIRLLLRRDRLRLAIWVLALLALTWISADAMGSTFPTQASIDAYAASVSGSPAIIAMSGPPIGLDTLAGIVLSKVSSTSIVGVSLIAMLTVVRHTRAEEEDGRAELLRATVVGRHAAAAATLVVCALLDVVLGVGTALAVQAASVPVSASWLYGTSVAALGLVFAGIALLLAQVFTLSRTVLGATLAVLAAAYVVRAAGDVRDDWLVWLSPVGWAQATHPLGGERWWPLVVPLAATVVLVGVTVALIDRRDVGAGLVAPRAGSPTASRLLSGPLGLALRQQRGALVGWGIGLLLLSAAIGSLSREVADMARGNPALSDYLATSRQGSLTDSYFSTMLLLATGLSRTRWLLGSLVVTLAGTVLLLVVCGLGLGLAYGLVVSDAGAPLRFAGLILVYVPAALALAALTVLLVGWVPRRAALVWAAVGFCLVIGWFGGLLRPPRWVEQLSPFSHTPAVPVEAVGPAGPSVVALCVVLMVGAGVVGLRRRDVG